MDYLRGLEVQIICILISTYVTDVVQSAIILIDVALLRTMAGYIKINL